MADNGSILPTSSNDWGLIHPLSWLSDLWTRARYGTLSAAETGRIAGTAAANVGKAGGSVQQQQAAANEVTNFVNNFWTGSGNTALVLGIVGVAVFAFYVFTDSSRPVRGRRRRSPIAGQGSDGSGVLAGVIAAAVAFYLWAHYLQSSHKLSFPSVPDVVSDYVKNNPVQTEVAKDPTDWWIPLGIPVQ